MRKLALLPAAALFFALAPTAARLGPVPSALLLVALGLLLAVAASDALSALTLTGGALGALSGGLLGALSPALGGAAALALCFAERGTRVRGKGARLLHLGLSLAIRGQIEIGGDPARLAAVSQRPRPEVDAAIAEAIDHRLLELMLRTDPRARIGDGYTKRLLRAVAKDLLPEPVRLRVDKRGFFSPQRDWLLGSRELVLDHLSAPPPELRELCNLPALQRTVADFYRSGDARLGGAVWAGLVASIWLTRTVPRLGQ